MRPDDNWREVKVLSEDLSMLLGIPKGSTEDFLTCLENLILHHLLEKISKDESSLGKDYSIELPYLGSLVVSIDLKGFISTNFVIRPVFYKKMRKCINQGVSPLTEQVCKVLGEELVDRMEEGGNIGES